MVRQLVAPQAEDMQGGQNYLQVEGQYFFCVEAIHDGTLADGKTQIKNGGLGIKLEVAQGPHKGEIVTVSLNDPNGTHKDGGKAAAAKQMAFLIACNVLTPAQANGETVSYDEQDARGQYLIAEVRFGDKKNPEDPNEKQYLQFHYSNIYHIDDPRVAKFEKDATILQFISATNRHPAEWFAPLIGKSKKTESAPPATTLNTDDL